MVNRYPTFTRAGVVTVVGVGVALARHFGVIIPDQESNALVDLIFVGGPLITAVWAARHTTPLADPRTNTGEQLVPASVANPPAPPTPEALDAAWAAFQAASVPAPDASAVAAPAPAVTPEAASVAAPSAAVAAVPVEADRPAPVQVTEWAPSA